MAEERTDRLLKQLAQSLRTMSGSSRWICLEPIDDERMRTLRQSLIESAPPPSTAVNRPQPISDRLSTETGISEKTEAEPPSSPLSMKNLDPLAAKTLDSMRLRLRDCSRCELCNERSKVVFGQGNINADLVFVGEGPGAEEDKSGIAFVGRAGKLLTQMIHAIGVNREAVYICNIVKCRPPGNRNPNGEEIATCSPFLLRQLEILQPRLIVTMGNIATKTLVPEAMGIMKMRGRLTAFHGTPLIPTFHPSYLLRNPSALTLVWNDMKQIRQVLFQQASHSAGEIDA